MTTATTSAKPSDEWLAAAMTDDAVVAEFLLRLKHSGESPPRKAAHLPNPPPRWGLRLPRSRPSLSAAARCDASSDSHRKEASDSTRRSPTTPLSWSGGGSGGSDGIEESSSGRRSSSGGRSKGIGADEIASILSKRSRKKSFDELKDEESLLLKERVSLKKDISSLRATYRENRATNDNLKKMKYGPNLLYPAQRAISGRRQVVSSTSSAAQPIHADHSQSSSNHHEAMEVAGSSRANPFLLPDLNMPPCEDDYRSETLYGLS